jgi:hypothetical protein
MIDGGGVGIWRHRRTPLDTLKTPVIALGSSEDSPQRIPQRIEWNNVGVGGGWHSKKL